MELNEILSIKVLTNFYEGTSVNFSELSDGTKYRLKLVTENLIDLLRERNGDLGVLVGLLENIGDTDTTIGKTLTEKTLTVIKVDDVKALITVSASALISFKVKEISSSSISLLCSKL